MIQPQIARARELLQRARRIVALTGAGISAESGVPTFRGPGGLWNGRRAETLATPGAFAADPHTVWEWYSWRRDLVGGCRPNAAHRALAVAMREGKTAVVTQNVDGLHRDALGRAAFDESALVELHGSLFGVRCTRCDTRLEQRGELAVDPATGLPECSACGGLLRPDVVWFGEPLDAALLDRAFCLAEDADVCLVVGTSAVVQPAASVASATGRSGGAIIEVNTEATPLTGQAAVTLTGSAAELVPAILDSETCAVPGLAVDRDRRPGARGGAE